MINLEHGTGGRRRKQHDFGVVSLDLLPVRTRRALGRAADRFTVGPGEVLLRNRATVQWVFIVLDGELVLRSPNGERVFRAGSAYGVLEAVGFSQASGELAARDITTVMAVPIRAYRALAETDPSFGYWVLTSLAAGTKT